MYGESPSDGSLVPTSNDDRHIFSVSQLNKDARELLEGHFPRIWIEGEISNLAQPASGHWYFTLKDNRAQLRCAMFRNRNQKLHYAPANGDQVLVRGHISLYEARGDYQLITDQMEAAGAGALQRAFEELKIRLHQEGLFEQKRPLPALPACIGVVTSPSGAAIRDILSILKRRFPAIPVIIYPTAVQGTGASGNIVAAITTANKHHRCDVLIVTRGGGSAEDLWSFNEENVARALFASSIPTLSAIGHEIDISIADFVADVRAPTPSAAAELVSPDQDEWQHTLTAINHRLRQLILEKIKRQQQSLHWQHKRFQQQHPGQRLLQQAQHLDALEQRLQRNISQKLQQQQLQLENFSIRLQRHQPHLRIKHLHNQFLHYGQLLRQSMMKKLENCQQLLGSHSHLLDTMSPLATLSRGYAIIQNDAGAVIRNTEKIRPGQHITARLDQGRLHCTINTIDKN